MTTEIKRTPPPPPYRIPPPTVAPAKRELRPSLGAAGAGLLVALTWTLWQGTGSRLALFVCAGTAAAGLVDVVWALVATKRVRLSVTSSPVEAVVGESVALTLEVAGPRQFLDIRVLTFATAPRGVDVPDASPAIGVAGARDVLTTVNVEVAGRGLAGLVGCARRYPLPLRGPLYIGPRTIVAAEHFPELHRHWGEGQARPSPEGDLVRGVRPYVAGDPMRRVHWRATARDLAGDLIVKEVEETGAPRLLIVLDLGQGGAAAEQAAGRAAWYAHEGLRRGYHVDLATAELSRRDGPGGTGPEAYRGQVRAVTSPVTSISDVIRRLAAASAPGKPDVPDDQSRATGGIIIVTDKGDSWR